MIMCSGAFIIVTDPCAQQDTVQNIQICWVADNVLEHPSAHDALLDCFARFGELASVAHASDVMNDQVKKFPS